MTLDITHLNKVTDAAIEFENLNIHIGDEGFDLHKLAMKSAALHHFRNAFNPQTARALLDRLEQLENFIGLISHLKYSDKVDIEAISGGAKLLLEKEK